MVNALIYTQYILFVTVVVFAIIILALSLPSKQLIGPDGQMGYRMRLYQTLSLITFSLSVVTLPTIVALRARGRGSFTNSIIFDVVLSTVLGIFWAFCGIISLYFWLAKASSCGEFSNGTSGANWVVHQCEKAVTLGSFSLLNGLLLLIYTMTLIIIGLKYSTKERSVWKDELKHWPFTVDPTSNTMPEDRVPVPQRWKPFSHHAALTKQDLSYPAVPQQTAQPPQNTAGLPLMPLGSAGRPIPSAPSASSLVSATLTAPGSSLVPPGPSTLTVRSMVTPEMSSTQGLTDHQLDYVHQLYRNNVPPEAVARIIERMLADTQASGSRQSTTDSGLHRRNTGFESPPDYDFKAPE